MPSLPPLPFPVDNASEEETPQAHAEMPFLSFLNRWKTRKCTSRKENPDEIRGGKSSCRRNRAQCPKPRASPTNTCGRLRKNSAKGNLRFGCRRGVRVLLLIWFATQPPEGPASQKLTAQESAAQGPGRANEAPSTESANAIPRSHPFHLRQQPDRQLRLPRAARVQRQACRGCSRAKTATTSATECPDRSRANFPLRSLILRHRNAAPRPLDRQPGSSGGRHGRRGERHKTRHNAIHTTFPAFVSKHTTDRFYPACWSDLSR